MHRPGRSAIADSEVPMPSLSESHAIGESCLKRIIAYDSGEWLYLSFALRDAWMSFITVEDLVPMRSCLTSSDKNRVS